MTCNWTFTMDHFNATVHNGALVSTRRGLHVSKTKHQGTRFVNTFITPDAASAALRARKREAGASRKRGHPSSHQPQEFTFVTDDSMHMEEGDEETWDEAWEVTSDDRESKAKRKETPRKKEPRKPQKPMTLASPELNPRTETPLSLPTTSSTSLSSQSLASASSAMHSLALLSPPTSSSSLSSCSSRTASNKAKHNSTNARPADSCHHSHIQPFSPSTSSNSAEAFFSKSPASFHTPQPWKSHIFGHDLPEPYQDLTYLYLQFAPQYLYPSEELLSYNPVCNSTFFTRINSSRATMQGIILIGTLIEASQRGLADTDALNKMTTAVCHFVNKSLQEGQTEPDLSVLECIAGMAMAGYFSGRYNHWNMHMRGLRHVLALWGGLKPEYGHIVHKIRKADSKGALRAGTAPCLEFSRVFPPLPVLVAPAVQSHLETRMQQVLQSCGISQCLIDPMRELVIYLTTLNTVRHSPTGENRLNPESYAEDYAWIQFQLLRNQGPINDIALPYDSSPDATRMQKAPTSPVAYRRPQTQSPQTSSSFDELHLPSLGPDVKSSPASTPAPSPLTVPTFVNPLDTVVRLAALLYTERVIPEPGTSDPYTRVFSVLNSHVRTINMILQSGWSDAPQLASLEYLRPVLIWACLTVCAMARLLGTDPVFRYEPIDLTPYENCLSLLGLGGSENVNSLSEWDMELCNLLPTINMVGIYTDDRTALKDALGRWDRRHHGHASNVNMYDLQGVNLGI